MKEFNKVDDLYELYGFGKSLETEDVTVYIYDEGYFQIVEILQKSENQEIAQNYSIEYREMGYSVKIVNFVDSESIHEHLFSSFFNINSSKIRLKQDYKNFSDLQSKKLLGNSYNYIEGRGYIAGGVIEKGVVKEIYNQFNEKGSQLIILEAAAGFGKTCTSYEVAKLLADDSVNRVTILAELSKHRAAKIFKYVLLSEMDNKFKTLPSSLVMQEIKNGKLPLIIDGFDELLSNSPQINSYSKSGEEAQTMLDTIAELLTKDSHAKVLLTSRKSSIFTGDIFDNWIETKIAFSQITRIQLVSPTISDWIGNEKKEVFLEKGISLDDMSNPVLLTILKNESLEEINESYKTVDDILNRYLNLLLSREKERQQLLLSEREQYEIMLKLAALMVQYDISSEDPLFIKELLDEILKLNLYDYLQRYTDSQAVELGESASSEEFLNKLVHHALLDRVSTTSNNIGFINDFIFGLLIGEGVIKGILPTNSMSNKYIDFSATAYSVKDDNQRKVLFSKLSDEIDKLSDEQKLNIDISLYRGSSRNYNNSYFDSVIFKADFEFDENFIFYDCTFSDCIFNNCKIPISVFESCQFYNCQFYNIDYIPNPRNVKNDLRFMGCTGTEKILEYLAVEDIRSDEEVFNYERFVLQQYWKVGYERAEPRRTYRTLFKGTSSEDRIYVNEAIESLLSRGLLRDRGVCLELDFTKMREIKEILGR